MDKKANSVTIRRKADRSSKGLKNKIIVYFVLYYTFVTLRSKQTTMKTAMFVLYKLLLVLR